MSAAVRRPVFSCLVFAVAGALLVVQALVGILLLPWTLLADRDRRVVARFGSALVRTALRMPTAWRPTIRELCAADLRETSVVVMNHASIADIALAVAIPGAPRLVAKPWVARIPLMRFVMWTAGHVVLDTSDPGSVRDGLEHLEGLLRRGTSVIVFPEGTRRAAAGSGALGEFESGAFWLAERAGVAVLPVVVIGSGDLIGKGSPWFTDARVSLRVLPRVQPVGDHRALRRIVRDAVVTCLEASRDSGDAGVRSPEPAAG